MLNTFSLERINACIIKARNNVSIYNNNPFKLKPINMTIRSVLFYQ